MSNKTESPKPRLKLSDFYFADKHAAGSRMPILLPSGEDSGEWLQVRGPDCDESVKAGRAYTAAYRSLQESLSELESECKAKEDWTKYNEQIGYGAEDLNKQLCLEIVTGWSFDEDFSYEALSNLLNQYRGLAEAIAKYHTASRDLLSAK